LYLLRSDLRELLLEDNFVYFIIHVVNQPDLRAMISTYDNSKGGQAAYHPRMMGAGAVSSLCPLHQASELSKDGTCRQSFCCLQSTDRGSVPGAWCDDHVPQAVHQSLGLSVRSNAKAVLEGWPYKVGLRPRRTHRRIRLWATYLRTTYFSAMASAAERRCNEAEASCLRMLRSFEPRCSRRFWDPRNRYMITGLAAFCLGFVDSADRLLIRVSQEW